MTTPCLVLSADLGGELLRPCVLHAAGVGRHHLGDDGELAAVAAADHAEVEDAVPRRHQRHLLQVLRPVAGLQHHGAPGAQLSTKVHEDFTVSGKGTY